MAEAPVTFAAQPQELTTDLARTAAVEDAVGTTSPRFCMDATVYNVRQCFGFTTTSAALLDTLVGDRQGDAGFPPG